jgi:murein DD-endopeptidase MepM/ murein hydrolase activator NlpD
MVREGSRRKAVASLVAVATVWVLIGAGRADAGLLPVESQPTTTTAPPNTTTTTAAPSRSGSSTTQAPAPHPDQSGDAAVPVAGDVMPDVIRSKVQSVARSGSNRTDGLLDALAPLEAYGLDETQRAVVGFGRFPVAGRAWWTDDWWMPRHTGPTWRVHEGLDIFAPYGTPVLAPVDGIAKITNGGLGGLAVTVRQPDGTYWYMCHLSGVAAGLATGDEVTTGQVVGFVGTSGDAQGTSPHVHLQIHPRGGAPIPPKPVVDRFVVDALGRVPQLLDAYAQAQQVPPTVPEAEVAPPSLSTEDALLWVSAANPAGGTLRLVQAAAEDAASQIDWSRR